MLDVKKIKQTLNKLEKKQKELATYRAKVSKIKKEISELEQTYISLHNQTQTQATQTY